MVAKIIEVVPGSIAAEIGIKPGFRLIALNGETLIDILDYRWAMANDHLSLSLLDDANEPWEVEIDKEYGEDIGLVFEHPTIKPILRCKNNCLFCFVAQLPSGVRPSLCVKDDDYRLSAFHGSFITLTNLSSGDWERLLAKRPSPLYISVHTTNGALRQKLMRNPQAGRILEQLRILADHHIEMHCQIVLVPGINDGEELQHTIQDLLSLWPAVQSVAVVPVGLTAHRENLPLLRRATGVEARAVIDALMPLSREAKRKLGVSFVYLADEFFLMSSSQVPRRDYYDDFPQIENGIGLTRLLLDDVRPLLRRLPKRLAESRRVVWVTGTLAAPVLGSIAVELNSIEGLWVDVCAVPNYFLGESVTVAGLLSGHDILTSLRALDLRGAFVLIPEVALRPAESDFIDGYRLADLQRALPQATIIATPTTGRALITNTLGEEA